MIALFATITDKDRNKRKGFLEPHPQELPNGTVYSLRISQRSAAILDFLLFRLSETLTLGRKRATRGPSFTFSIMTWQIWLAVAVIILTAYGLVKHYETRMLLLIAGFVMCIAAAVSASGCDKHLVAAVAKPLKKLGGLLTPAATILTFAINIAIMSAAGTAATAGATFIPLPLRADIRPRPLAVAIRT